MPGELYSALKTTLPILLSLSFSLSLSLARCVCWQFSEGSFIDLYLISLQYSNRASVLQSGADLSTSLKVAKKNVLARASVCMYKVCVFLDVCCELLELYQTNSFSHWSAFNNAEFVCPELQ